MARKKGGDRQEPHFDDSDHDDFRLTADDRPGVFVTDEPRKKSVSKPKSKSRREPEWDTEDGLAPERGSQERKKPSRAGKTKSKKGKTSASAPVLPKRSFLRRAVYWTMVLGIWCVLGIAALLTYYAMQLPPLSTLEVPERAPNIAILGNDGKLLVNRGARGQAIKLAQMPKFLPQAVIAIEDRNFYSHYGVDPSGLARAFFSNLRMGGVRQGGSTLTQQLAKNIFLTPERSLDRKIQELILSFWLEAKLSKDQILELYLNRVYLGAGTYGVEAASQRYFNSSVRDINLQQAAILAGLLKAPSRYAPTRSVSEAMSRAKTVLAAMVETGAITQKQADAAAAQKLVAAKVNTASDGINYAADWIMDLLPNLVENIDSDIFVETTIDTKLEATAGAALKTVLEQDGQKYGVAQGAVVSMATDGAVKALIGGKDYQESQYNRATVAKRQPGSSFKPFVYLTAMNKGLTPDDKRQDAPLSIKGWHPENYSRQYRGAVTLREALALSLNTVAVRLALEVGTRSVIKTAQALGITSTLLDNASIALGTSEVTLLEMVRSYASFANGGVAITPYIVTRIQNSKGQVLFDRKPQLTGPLVIEPQVLSEMNDMLSSAVVFGTARRARVGNWPVAGKTGTSQDFRDGWFMGFTSHMITGVWVGNDDGTPTKHASGSNVPIEVWNKVMAQGHQGLAPEPLPGVREAAPLANDNEPTIDDVLIGNWDGTERSGTSTASEEEQREQTRPSNSEWRNETRPSDGQWGSQNNQTPEAPAERRTQTPEASAERRTQTPEASAERRTQRQNCPLDAGFLNCVFN